jgi:hypothetical protein
MQISPDGRHAAFVTAARLSGYDNQGIKEMYTYDADSGIVRCASCRPDGIPPTTAVEASQGGPFMTDDGRAFFVTGDPLVPQDTDGIRDVYEFVNGRPQLITAGTGTRDSTGGGANASPFFPAVHTGLESVSANGTDVFFSTYDTLVPQDHNGPFVKFYDARTGGGFDIDLSLGPCAAADECHGPGNPVSPPPSIATGGDLGNTGNVQQTSGRRAQKKTKQKHRRKRRHKRHRSRNHG